MSSLHACHPALRHRTILAAAIGVATLGLAACGGGGGSPGNPPIGGVVGTPQACSPTNPYRADAAAPTTTGSLDIEKAWVKDYMTQAYLWYSEIPTVDPSQPQFSNPNNHWSSDYSNPGSINNYFNALLTPAITPSGKYKDEFSFTYSTRLWEELTQGGTSAGYGLEWVYSGSGSTRVIRVAYVDPSTPAATAGVRRGDTLISADGVSAQASDQGSIDTLNAALFPSTAGAHIFVFSRSGTPGNITTTMVAGTAVPKTPVPLTSVINYGGTRYGYLVFNDHILTAEGGLVSAINSLKAQGATELVLDLRYNGGGYLFLASELAYMIAGPGSTTGKVFETLQYNNKRSSENQATPFYSAGCFPDSNFNCTNTAALPYMGISRVSVIAGPGTCSASEAIVNGLRGVDVDVRLIGGTTCGKPYGFTAKDNCGISYFPIEFQGVNDKGFGSYADGFSPTCAAADDLEHQRGDIHETLLSTAINNLRTGSCAALPMAAAVARGTRVGPQAQAASDGNGLRLLRGPERENRILAPINKK